MYRSAYRGAEVAVKHFQPPKGPKAALHPDDSCVRDFLHEAHLLHELRHPVRHCGCLRELILRGWVSIPTNWMVILRERRSWLRRTCCCSSAC